MTEIKAPYNVFFGEDGYPLEGGYIFIGLDGLNPLSNPQQAYWDPALTIPAANVRTSGGRPSNNGVIGRLYVPGDYSILVQDKNGRTVYSQLSVTFEYSDLLVTESRGTLTRSARAPLSFSFNDIVETGFYAWTNGATTNQPAACAAGDVFSLQVISSPDGAGTIVQALVDATLYRRFARLSLDGGTTWSTWKEDDGLLPYVEELTADKTYTAAELDRDKLILLGTGCAAVDITAGASKDGARLTFVQVDATPAVVTFGASRTFSIVANTAQELVWDDTNSDWRAPAVRHGVKQFGPGALAATDWVVPPGVRQVRVTGVGQGGTAGAASSGTRGGGGGGAGAWCRNLAIDVIDGETITVTLSTSAASTLVSALSGLNLSFGKGSNGSNATGGAGGTGSGGVSNGGAGGNGASSGGYGGGGGGGVGGNGANAGASGAAGGGGSGGQADNNKKYTGGPAGLGPYLNGSGGSVGVAGTAEPGNGPGAGGAGSYAGSSVTTAAGGPGGYGGGGGGGSGNAITGNAGAGGAPFIVIEW